MDNSILLQKGFVETPHLIVKIFTLDIGRNRYISVGALATPNEVIFLGQKDDNNYITDLVCIHNFDYDGYLTETKLNNIISAFT